MKKRLLTIICGFGLFLYLWHVASQRRTSVLEKQTVAVPAPSRLYSPKARQKHLIEISRLDRKFFKFARDTAAVPSFEISQELQKSRNAGLTKRTAREQLWNTLRKKGARTIQQKGATFLWSSALRAIPEGQSAGVEAEILTKAHGMAYVRLPDGASPPRGSFPIAMRESTLTFGIITGNIGIKADPALWNVLSDTFQLKLIQGFEHLNLAYFRTDRTTQNDLLSLVEVLKKQPGVSQVNLEILDRAYVSN